jgi:hypothetical protein
MPWVLSMVRRHAHMAGVDLHANVAVPVADRARLEQLGCLCCGRGWRIPKASFSDRPSRDRGL